MKKLALLLPIISGVFWGSSGVVIRVLSSAGLDNMTINFVRSIVGLVVVFFIILFTDKSLFKINLRDIPLIVSIGVVGYMLMNVFYNEAVAVLSLSLAAVLLCTAPVFVLIMSVFLFGEKMTGLKLGCTIAALFGCFLLSGIVESGKLEWSVLGIVLGFGSAISNAYYTIGIKATVDKGYNALTINFYSYLFSMLCLLPLSEPTQIVNFISNDRVFAIVLILINGAAISLLPNTIYAMSIKYVDPGKASVLAGGAEPTAATLYGMIAYREIPSLVGFAGIILTIGSILTLSSAKPIEKE